MPLIQKLIQLGNSRVVVIPASWLNYFEKKTGTEITMVTLEVNGEIKVKPVLKEEVEAKT